MTGPLQRIGQRFTDAGYSISLVGGPVRDALLGRLTEDTDLDFATDAHPDQVLALLEGWAEAVWDVGIRFGTVGARVDGREVEITTYRTEAYEADSRKPEVVYGTEFTRGPLATRFHHQCDGHDPARTASSSIFSTGSRISLRDVFARRLPLSSLSTTIRLRMMRAARFAAQLGFTSTTMSSPR